MKLDEKTEAAVNAEAARMRREDQCDVRVCTEPVAARGWVTSAALRALAGQCDLRERREQHDMLRVCLCVKHVDSLKAMLPRESVKGPPCLQCAKPLRPHYTSHHLDLTFMRQLEDLEELPEHRREYARKTATGWEIEEVKEILVGRTFDGDFGDYAYRGHFCGVTCAGAFGFVVARRTFVFDQLSKSWKPRRKK